MGKKLALVLLVMLFQSCVIFKKVENNYYLKHSKVINNAGQSISGSEVDGKVKAALK